MECDGLGNDKDYKGRVEDDQRIISLILNNQVEQRRNCMKIYLKVLGEDPGRCVDSWMYANHYKKLLWKSDEIVPLTKFNSIGPNDADIFIRICKDNDFNTNRFIIGLAFNALNQFCFWFDRNDLSERSLRSSDIGLPQIEDKFEFLKLAPTLLKERTQLNNNFSKYLHSISSYNMRPIELIWNILNFEGFNYDVFRKKKELFLMFMFRYFDALGLPEEFNSIRKWVNPAIDYQVPKMLEATGIISYPTNIKRKIDKGKLILKDSYEELYIRSLSYFTLIDMQSKFHNLVLNGERIDSFDQVDLDWYFWSRRNENNVWGYKHHCTITEDY